MDGKHARNTKQSTPLGCLFDHGVDGCAMMLISFAVVLSVMPTKGHSLDASFGCAISWLLPQASFFLAQWEQYCTGILGTAGVTESQIIACCFFLMVGQPGFRAWFFAPLAETFPRVDAFFKATFPAAAAQAAKQRGSGGSSGAASRSPHWLDAVVDTKGLVCGDAREFVLILCGCWAVIYSGTFLYRGFRAQVIANSQDVTRDFSDAPICATAGKNATDRKKGKLVPVSAFAKLKVLVPYGWHLVCSFLLFSTDLFTEQPELAMLVCGLNSVTLVLRMIVCSLTHLPFPVFAHKSTIPFSATCLFLKGLYSYAKPCLVMSSGGNFGGGSAFVFGQASAIGKYFPGGKAAGLAAATAAKTAGKAAGKAAAAAAGAALVPQQCTTTSSGSLFGTSAALTNFLPEEFAVPTKLLLVALVVIQLGSIANFARDVIGVICRVLDIPFLAPLKREFNMKSTQL